jgi:hypothetical protein
MDYHWLDDEDRAAIQARRDAEPPLSNRRRKRLYAAALREDRKATIAELEYLDDQLLRYAIG